METQTIKVFISYAHEDSNLLEIFKRGLKGHLIQHRNYQFQIWDDNEIAVGQDWEKQINTEIEESSICLLLISSYFVSSQFCTNKELKEFIDKSKQKRAIVIPILLRSIQINDLEGISKLQFFKTFYEDYDKEGHELMPFDEIIEPQLVEKYVQKYCYELAEKIKDAVVKNKLIIKTDTYSVREGKILHNIPDEMEYNKVVLCKIKIAYDEKLLRKDIEESTDIAKSLEVGDKMAVSLKPLDPTDFDIFELSPEYQEVVMHAASEWNFSVKPKRLGSCPLYLEAYVVNENGERVTIGYSENINVLSSIDHETDNGFKDSGKKIVAFFPFTIGIDEPGQESPAELISPTGKNATPISGAVKFIQTFLPVVAVGLLTYLIFFYNTSEEVGSNPVDNDISVLVAPLPMDSPFVTYQESLPIVPAHPPIISPEPAVKPVKPILKPDPPKPVVVIESPEMYKIRIVSKEVDFPKIYVNNKITPYKEEKNEKYIEIAGGMKNIVILDSLGRFVCKSEKIEINKNITIRFSCRDENPTLQIQIIDDDLKGNVFLRYKTFYIDKISYETNQHYNVKSGIITIPKLKPGKYVFSLTSTFCNQPFEVKTGTKLVKISCFKK